MAVNPFAKLAVLRNLALDLPGNAHLKTFTEHQQYPATVAALRFDGHIDAEMRLTTSGKRQAAHAIERLARIPLPRHLTNGAHLAAAAGILDTSPGSLK